MNMMSARLFSHPKYKIVMSEKKLFQSTQAVF